MPRISPFFTTQKLSICIAFSTLSLVVAEDAPSTRYDPAIYAQGRFVYERNCLVCHGKRGDGKGELAVGLHPQPRDFRSGIFKYRSTPSGKLPTDKDLEQTIREGLSETAMPKFDALSSSDVAAVISYIKTYSSKWKKPELHGEPIALPRAPAWLSDPAIARAKATAGRDVYFSACATCHAADGSGKGEVPDLVDEWGHPCPPPDLRRPYIRTGSRPGDIYKTLVTGLNGTPMPSFLESLSEDQRWELIAFILDLRKSTREVEAVTPRAVQPPGG